MSYLRLRVLGILMLITITIAQMSDAIAYKSMNEISLKFLNRVETYDITLKLDPNLSRYFSFGVNKKVRIIIFVKGDVVNLDELKSRYLSRKYRTFEDFETSLNTYRKEVTLKLSEAYRENLMLTMRRLRTMAVKILKVIEPLGAIVVISPVCLLDEIASLSTVTKIILDKKVKINLDVAAKTIFADYLWSMNITGGNFNDGNKRVDVAILDTGISDHPALSGKVIASKSFVVGEDANDYAGHGTHVAGIVASNDNTYRGIAWNVTLINAKCFNSEGEGRLSDVMDAAIWALSEVPDTAEVINFSASINETYPNNNGNSYEALLFDWLVDTYYAIICAAAGNDGPGGSSIDSPADAYNVIAVGASNDNNTISRGDDTIAQFSSRGPTADGRIKPDIIAPGTNIISTWLNGGWAEASGTSMATPMISGSAALLIPYLVSCLNIPAEYLPLAIKAILINSADDYGSLGSDNDWGWGYVNLRRAISIANYTYWGSATSTGLAAKYIIEIPAGVTFKVTLVWPRHVKRLQTGDFEALPLTSFSVKLVNSNGITIAEESFDGKNNIIQMEVEITQKDNYSLEIYINSMSVDYEIFVVSTNVPPSIVYPEIDEEIIAPRSASDDMKITIIQRIKNIGVSPANVSVFVEFNTEQVELINTSSSISLGKLEPFNEKNITWIIKPLALGTIYVVFGVEYSYYVFQAEIRKTIQITVYDDDSLPPKVESVSKIGTMLALLKYRIEAKISDASGVSKAICYIRYNSRIINEENFDLKIEMKYDSTKDVFYCEFSAPFKEVKVYVRIYAVDADDDRPNDAMYAWSDVFELGEISILPHTLAAFMIVIILVVAIIKRRK